MSVLIESDHVMYLSALNTRSDRSFLVLITFDGWFTAVCRQRPTRKSCKETHVRCRWKIRYVSKFTAASRGSPCDSTAF